MPPNQRRQARGAARSQPSAGQFAASLRKRRGCAGVRSYLLWTRHKRLPRQARSAAWCHERGLRQEKLRRYFAVTLTGSTGALWSLRRTLETIVGTVGPARTPLGPERLIWHRLRAACRENALSSARYVSDTKATRIGRVRSKRLVPQMGLGERVRSDELSPRVRPSFTPSNPRPSRMLACVCSGGQFGVVHP